MSKLKNIIKTISKSNAFIKILSILIYFYINIVYFTSKKYYIYSKNFNKKLLEENNVIYAFWHNRLALMFFAVNKSRKTNVIISNHKDGQIIAQTTKLFGQKVIEGSSSDISMTSLRQILKSLTDGESLAVTPDGPRGPVYKINSNISKIAQKTSKMIIPISFSCKKKRIMRSWDKFVFPLPFNTIYFIYGNPIKPDHNDIKSSLEKELNRIHKEFDEKFA